MSKPQIILLKRFYSDIKQKKSFLRSFRIYTSANILERAIPFFLMPVLTRLLSPFDYGIIATFNAVRTNVEPAISMATAGAAGRAYYDRDKEGFNFHQYLFNALIVNFALMFAVLFGVVILKDFIPGMREIGIFWLLLAPIFVWATATSNIKVKLWIYQRNPRPYGIYRVMKTLIEVALSILLVCVLSRSWKGRITGVGLTEILFCFIAMYMLYRHDKPYPSLNKGYINDILKFGLPLLPHSFGWMLIGTADKFFLNSIVGVSVTGIYGVAFTIAAIIPLLSSPVDMSIEPIIYEKLSNLDDQSARKLVIASYVYFSGLIIAAIVLWQVSPLILKILVDKKFWGASEYILWLALGHSAYGMYRLFSKYIAYAKKTHLMAYNTLISGVVAVIASYSLIKVNGAVGAAQATCIAYITSFLLTWWMANRLYPMPWFSIFKPKNLKEVFQ